MSYITGWIVVGIITLGIYKLFELFVCRKERIAMIEKLADRVNTGEINSNLSLNLNYYDRKIGRQVRSFYVGEQA